jgi:hypothetical protein
LEPRLAIAVVVINPIFDGVLRFVDGIEWRYFHFLSSRFATLAPKRKTPLVSGALCESLASITPNVKRVKNYFLQPVSKVPVIQ